jgi:hypothetical protein
MNHISVNINTPLTHPVRKHDQKTYTEKVSVNRAILCNAQNCSLDVIVHLSLRAHRGSNQCWTVTWFGRLELSVRLIKIESKLGLKAGHNSGNLELKLELEFNFFLNDLIGTI